MEPQTRYPPDDPREWLNRARSSLRLAEAVIDGVYLDDLCYSAQQAAEKAIKAVLITRNVRFPYVHDLEVLLNIAENAGFVVPAAIRAAKELTRYALDLRYPTRQSADEPTHIRAVEVAQTVVAWATTEIARRGARPDAVRESPSPLYPREPPKGEGRAPDPALIDELVARIVAVADPEAIILFGSAARGTMGPHSDLDLLIVKSEPYHQRELAGAIRTSLQDLGVVVDLILATPEDLERYGQSWALVYRPALEEGRVVYQATHDTSAH